MNPLPWSIVIVGSNPLTLEGMVGGPSLSVAPVRSTHDRGRVVAHIART